MARIATFIRTIKIASYSRALTAAEAHAFALACQVTDRSRPYEVAAVHALIGGLGRA